MYTIIFNTLDPAARKLKIRQTIEFIQVGARGFLVVDEVVKVIKGQKWRRKNEESKVESNWVENEDV